MKSCVNEEGLPLRVIYCDNHLLVVDKPAGLSTQPHMAEDSLEERAKKWVKEHYGKKGSVFLQPIHRLDKPVSGIVVFARTSKALSRVQAAMRLRSIHKTYLARVEGIFSQTEALLEDYLIHDEHIARISSRNVAGAKKAILHYRVLEEKKGQSLLEIKLETGRYHQIRIQLASRGFPVVGDRKYGSKVLFKKEHIALHHARMELIHPVTKDKLLLQSPAPF